MKIIKDVNIVNHNSIIFGDIYIENKKIIKIVKISNKERKDKNYCIPGFIDQHTHGGYGISFDNIINLNINEIKILSQKLEKEGVCGFFLTTVTQSIENLIKIGNYIKENKNPIIIGWHIEGPFISKNKKGAHEKKYIIPISKKTLDEINKTNDLKKIFTIAPEENESIKIIKNYKNDNKVFFSIGHSNADYHTTENAIKNGCSQFTHLFNAMSGFDHRNPGIVNFALDDKNSYVELITDGVHINDIVLKEAFNICTANRIIIVSDCLSPKGLKNGIYHLGNLEIEKRNNQCFLINTNKLAGSTMKYIDIVKHFYKITNCNMMEIVKMTSYNTAKQFNLKNYGIIKENKNAKIIICDKKMNIIETIF